MKMNIFLASIFFFTSQSLASHRNLELLAKFSKNYVELHQCLVSRKAGIHTVVQIYALGKVVFDLFKWALDANKLDVFSVLLTEFDAESSQMKLAQTRFSMSTE